MAQNEFVPGSYTLHSGKKVEGLIKNQPLKPWDVSFEFKEKDGPTVSVSAESVQEVTIEDNSIYLRRRIRYDQSIDRLNNLNFSSQPDWSFRTGFIKLVVDGQADLFVLQDDGGDRFYFRRGDASIQPLVYKRYLKDQDIAYNRQFRGQLATQFADCLSLSPSDFESLLYQESSLIGIFKKFNNCISEDAVLVLDKEKRKPKITLRLKAGVNFSDYEVENDLSENFGGDFGSKTSFRGEAEGEIMLSGEKSHWALFLGLGYYPGIDKTIQQPTGSINTPIQDVTLKYLTSFEIPVGARYYFPITDKVRLSLQAGFLYTYVKELSITYSATNIDLKEPSFGIGKPLIGFGIHVDRFFVESRFDFEGDVFQGSRNKMTNNTINFVAGVQLF
ncbi:outer membrane beta-barrel protein [Aureitalea marina]|uniref:Outer membrane protein beta-barrel domain-containing protein n=1 Tax=Aureitalea marina TaxID=930804 RepID=A0A2S7KP04_9FLAO|nr:outer membrane beta-barrel protein [Aureitalea marina]PQB04359.1 hypothetical protein BST85_05200 [Aureitalea marina]